MSDIVEQLESLAEYSNLYGFHGRAETYTEAAAEIERLRAKLEIKTSEVQSMRETSIQHCRERNKAERELAEARDKALDEALKVIGERQEFYSRKCEKERERQNYEQVIALGDIVIALNIAETNIRALKSPKPPIL